MTQYYSRTDINYAGDSNFTIPFSYIDKDDISVYVNDEFITTWTWLNDSQINISSTLTTGDVITIKRNTPIDEKIVTYQNMSMVLSDDNLNLSQDQMLNAVQEIWDNNLDTTAISREALTKANTAVSTANSANSKADNAVSTANTASSNASTALSNSQTAINTANSASNTATSASNTATAASNKVDEFGETIEVVIEAAEKIGELEEAVQTAVDAASTASDKADLASDKADLASDKADDAIAAADRAEAVIPSQTGQNGKFLSTNGTNTSWETVDLSSKQDTLVSGTNIKTINNNTILGSGNLDIDALPSQTGQSGKFLTTNGTAASWEKVLTHNLFDFKWTDHLINDQSWLRADNFTWQDGTVYIESYNHLVDDIDGITADTETIGSYLVTFYRATDGHKIVLADQETIVDNIYSETGIAWYYILDIANTRYKLPRTKFGFEGLRTDVGDLIEAGLPNITGTFGPVGQSGTVATGAFSKGSNAGPLANSGDNDPSITFDASRSNPTYGNSDTVQEQATQMYLYFYVGEFNQTATEQTAGLNSELFNNKADVDLTNCTTLATVHCVVETYVNGTSWYRIYDDGWCEQGGNIYIGSDGATVSLLKNYINTNYNVQCTGRDKYSEVLYVKSKSTTSFTMYTGDDSTFNASWIDWYAKGYIA